MYLPRLKAQSPMSNQRHESVESILAALLFVTKFLINNQKLDHNKMKNIL